MIVYNAPGVEWEIVIHTNATDRAKAVADKLEQKLKKGGISPQRQTTDSGSKGIVLLFGNKDRRPVVSTGFLFEDEIDKEITNVIR